MFKPKTKLERIKSTQKLHNAGNPYRLTYGVNEFCQPQMEIDLYDRIRKALSVSVKGYNNIKTTNKGLVIKSSVIRLF